MGRLIIPAINQVSGPWLVSHENLATLDLLFSEIDGKLKDALEKTIEETSRLQSEESQQTGDLAKRKAKLGRKYSTHSKTAEVTFSDGSTYKGSSIRELLDHINSTPVLSPVEIYIRTMLGSHDNEFNLIVNSNPGREEVDFEYRIRCLDYDIQLELKTLLDKWVRENKPSQSLRIWSNYIAPIIWFIGTFTILASYSNLSTTSSKAENYKQELKKEAQDVISQNQVSINTDSTLLLLLKLQADYVPENIKSETTTIYDTEAKKVLIASSIIFIISLFRPRTIIGIGKNEWKYKFFVFWWKYITWGGMGLLLSTLLGDSFAHFIQW